MTETDQPYHTARYCPTSCSLYTHALLYRLAGVFHGAIVLGTVEFSFGFCEQGTGVYAVKVRSHVLAVHVEQKQQAPAQHQLRRLSVLRGWVGVSAAHEVQQQSTAHLGSLPAEQHVMSPCMHA
jgi:hypothetical protein